MIRFWQIGSALTGNAKIETKLQPVAIIATTTIKLETRRRIEMRFSDDEVYAIFAFIRNHEKEDIPEDIWDISERIYEWMYENG